MTLEIRQQFASFCLFIDHYSNQEKALVSHTTQDRTK